MMIHVALSLLILGEVSIYQKHFERFPYLISSCYAATAIQHRAFR